METKSVMIVGVGGQGSLLASRILGNVLLQQGYAVKVSEVHGMSQRGGSVVTYVKYGDAVYSPVVEKGEADVIISFELLEAARWASCLKKGGKIVTSTQTLDPMPVITGAASYPTGIVKKLTDMGIDVTAVVSKKMDFDEAVWQEALNQCVPAKFIEMNRKAFALGREA